MITKREMILEEKLIEQVSKKSNIFKINFRYFITNQDKIQKRYKETLEKTNTRMEIIDKYILQFLEEIWEAQNEVDIVGITTETIDAIMYLGSLYAYMRGEMYSDCVLIDELFITNAGYCSDIEQVKNDLISIRRLFPERKWHKKEKSELIDEDLFLISSDIIIGLIKNLFGLILEKENYKKLIEIDPNFVNSYYSSKIKNFDKIK